MVINTAFCVCLQPTGSGHLNICFVQNETETLDWLPMSEVKEIPERLGSVHGGMDGTGSRRTCTQPGPIKIFNYTHHKTKKNVSAIVSVVGVGVQAGERTELVLVVLRLRVLGDSKN